MNLRDAGATHTSSVGRNNVNGSLTFAASPSVIGNIGERLDHGWNPALTEPDNSEDSDSEGVSGVALDEEQNVAETISPDTISVKPR